MPLSKATITGSYRDAVDAAGLTNVRAVFVLSGFDTESAQVIVNTEVAASLDAAMALPAGFALWKNTAGLRGTYYRHFLRGSREERPGFAAVVEIPLGNVQVGSASSYTVPQLLNNPVPDAPSWNLNIDPSAAELTVDRASIGEATIIGDATIAGRTVSSDRATLDALATAAQVAPLVAATWATLSGLTGAAVGAAAEVLDTDTGTHTDPVVGGTVANAGRYSWSASPAGWQWIGATGLAGKASVSDMAAAQADIRKRAQRFVVPSFGARVLSLTMTPNGVPVDVRTSNDIRVPRVTVPRFGAAVRLTMTSGGVPIAGSFEGGAMPPAFPYADLVAAEGGVDIRPAAGTVTGRVLDHLWLRRSPGIYVPLTGGPNPVQLVDTGVGTAAIRRGGTAGTVKWRPTPLGDGTVMELILIIGQSLAQGHVDAGQPERVPYWRDPVAERAWQFAHADGIQRGPRLLRVAPLGANRDVVIDANDLMQLAPLRGSRHANNPQYSQTSAESCALALVGQHLDRNAHVLAAVIGTGSTEIAKFASGSAHYSSAQMVIAAAVDRAAELGLTCRVWLVWNQGEEDNEIGTSQATYESVWLAIRNGLAAYAVSEGATFGGTVIQQTCQRPSSATGMATLAHASLIATGEALGVMPPAMGAAPYSGSTHLLPLTYLPLGAATGYEIARLIAGGGPATPHVAAGGALLTTGTQIDCTISGGSGAFVFDSTLTADVTRGVRVTNSGGDVPIASMALTGPNALRIALASSISIGSAPVVSFGLTGAGANNSRVSIRDDSAWTCPCTGLIVSGWMMHHQVAVS